MPIKTTDCDHVFGEQYLYTSCTNKFIDSPCPLRNLPRYNFCPGQYKDRVGTIIGNQELTFAVKSIYARGVDNALDVYRNNIFVR